MVPVVEHQPLRRATGRFGGTRTRAGARPSNTTVHTPPQARATVAISPTKRRGARGGAASILACAPLPRLAGAAGEALPLGMLVPTPKFLLIGCVPAIPLVIQVPDLALFLPWVLLGIG